MKLAIFTDTYLPQINGVVSFLEAILPKLAKSNDIVLFAPGKRKRTTAEKKGKGFKVYWMPASHFPYYEGYRMSKVVVGDIEKILKKENVEVVHAHAPVLLGLQGILIAKRMGIPIVATYHTHLPEYLPYLLNGIKRIPSGIREPGDLEGTFSGIRTRLEGFKIKGHGILSSISKKTVKGLIRFVYSMADVSTAPTDELVKELRSYGVKNVVKLTNGVDLSKMKSDHDLDKEFRKRYGIPDKRIILYVGRVGFEKRLEVLLEAAKRLKSREWCLVIVGSGPQLENYKEQASALGLKQAVFTGFVEDRFLPAAYSCADLFVSPSDSETFGLTFIEAMAFGLPVIGVNRLGPKELIDDGRDGFLVRPGSSRQMAARIRQILDDPGLRRRMGEAAKKTAERYSIRQSMKETMEIYKKLKK